ncbi:MAG: hypothetical protein DHS20C12_29530 [Pseudohongiella sp.]|nr:MAG: hypothetical protein DHS20C12_29530 [Pseudohongiella sp.]
MNRFCYLAAASIVISSTVHAADANSTAYTFTRDVQPILQENCQDCHRPSGKNFGGMVAPMSLISYEETRPWAALMAQRVSSREMPPWDAHEDYNGIFANERTLSDKEIATIVGWAEQGAPQGDPAEAPAPREFPSTQGGWLEGIPDLIVDIPVAFTIGDDVDDVYTAFTVDLSEVDLPEDVYIQGFQTKPGVKFIHHFNAHILAPDENGELPPAPAQGASDTVAPAGAGLYLGGMASGSEANMYPIGYGAPLLRGTRVTFDIHYHKKPGPGTGAVDDKSQIGFYFTKEPPKSAVGGSTMMRFDIDIPPGEPAYVMERTSSPIETDSEIVLLMPHMHTRGKEARFEVLYPNGNSEVLIEVPRYDFSWQTVYYYKEMKPIPKGARLKYTALYDNSPEYALERGFDPTQNVRFGQKSSDEMMMGFVMLAPIVD